MIELPGGGGAELVSGRLSRCWGPDGSVPFADPALEEPAAADLRASDHRSRRPRVTWPTS